MARVKAAACGGYERETVRESLSGIMDSMGGMHRFVSPGDRVLLKPNLLAAAVPEKCVTTHPEIVRAVAVMVLEAGGMPFIADSPGLDGFPGVAGKTGMESVARELAIPCRELGDPVPLSMAGGSVFQRVEVSRQAVEADKIINLPKLKTHAQMMLTLGVKNLFGTVVRQNKAQWHYNVGLDREIFADLHIDISRSLAPAITILDGVEGMEGRGPGNGRPRHFGLVAASSDPLALDIFICSLLGAEPEAFPLYRAAKKRGLLPTVEGGFPDFHSTPVFRDVDIPRLDSLHLLPGFLDGFGKRHLASRPVQNSMACIGCGKCAALCPAGAMKQVRDGHITIDYGKCIRCYCCQEICPADAIGFSRGLVLSLLELIRR